MKEPLPIEAIQAAYKVYEIAHKCGNCISSDPTKVKTTKLNLIAEAILEYEQRKK